MSTEASFLFLGLEDVIRMCRADPTVATRRRIRLATIVPLDAGHPADGTATRIPDLRGLLLAWQFTAHRTAELLDSY